ncbi:MAG TPA: hypothetical protein VFT85_02810 [Acidimicrobiia bacterium]|nr:hypothetical protein [Acidimicrobiia bacterium]
MSVELEGNVRMRGDSGPGVRVRVIAGDGRLRLASGDEPVGDWLISDIGVMALQDGFGIKAEGEEFVLRTSDDVALAEEIGIAAASPRLARRIAARHNPDRDLPAEPREIRSNLAAIGFALAGALVVLGGILLSPSLGVSPLPATLGETAEGTSFDFWLAFIVGGVLMIAMGYVMSIGARFARAIATVVLVVMILAFGLAVRDARSASELTAYGFIAGGLVVGVAVLVGAGSNQPD